MKIIYRPIGIIYDNITLDIGPYMSYVTFPYVFNCLLYCQHSIVYVHIKLDF